MEPLHDRDVRGFGSDNQAGVHPDVLAAVLAANGGHQLGYGGDVYTRRLAELVVGHFGDTATAYPVFTGTGANVVALQALTSRWESVVCAESAHVNVDECGAPERMGLKLLSVETPDGKLTPALVDRRAWGFGDEHHSQPKVVSLTQSTELGTVYTVAELARLVEQAHARGMVVHLDGARLANAAAALEVPLRALTTDVGVDVVSFGGTKNGAMGAECVIVLNPDAVRGVQFLRKSSMQLASKMRFVSAQLVALLSDGLWLRNATHANAMARRLETAVRGIHGVHLTRPAQANAVFAVAPAEVTARLQRRFPFYVWDESTGEVRWMTSWDTTEADVDAFAAAVRAELAEPGSAG
ncbi:MAG TPA: beta-eliminating lyase-related protein [Dermatophilaceae bacterium]|nr:beta-eliminating lyase-related protein [Dermatophilaceae bacterium]